MKDYLMKSMDNCFSPHLSAYRSSCSTQHGILHLIDEWKTYFDSNFIVGTVLMDFPQPFNCIPYNI